jgi:hypothetical protein
MSYIIIGHVRLKKGLSQKLRGNVKAGDFFSLKKLFQKELEAV